MSESDKLQYRIALTFVKGVGNILGKQLLDYFGDAVDVFNHLSKSTSVPIRGVSDKLIQEFHRKELLKRAEQEVEFIAKHAIQTYYIGEASYPEMLRDLNDAPILLYGKGNGTIETDRTYSIVGTRKPTSYGLEMTERIVSEIATCSDAKPTVISGLAYGIDIAAHRTALRCGIPTIAVLAHGLDRIYPAQHRNTAKEILSDGLLLTEYPTGTEPEKYNFVARNRIVAALSRATIVIESAAKGGSLITAQIANSYGREVFALPGRVTDKASAGTIELIRRNQAQVLLSGNDFCKEMGWSNLSGKPAEKGVTQECFELLGSDERQIIQLLQEADTLHINEITSATDLPASKLAMILLQLEFEGLVRPIPGGCYQLFQS